MLEQDYLMRLLLAFWQAMNRSIEKAKDGNPQAAADTLELAIGDAVDIDGATLLSLAPESMAAVIQVSGTDPRVIEYVARSLLLESEYLRRAGQEDLADLREAQGRAVAEAYDIDLYEDDEDSSPHDADPCDIEAMSCAFLSDSPCKEWEVGLS